VCGSCARIDGPAGSVTVRIVDRCPECKPGDIDLSPQAFEQIAPLADGRVTIHWEYVPCAVEGPVVYHFKEGSNPWWTAIQVRNHRHAVAKLEWRAPDGDFRVVPRESYNFFVESSGMGEGPYTLRVTDVLGNVLTDEGIPFIEAGDAPGKGQFPGCP
jgi:expansin